MNVNMHCNFCDNGIYVINLNDTVPGLKCDLLYLHTCCSCGAKIYKNEAHAISNQFTVTNGSVTIEN